MELSELGRTTAARAEEAGSRECQICFAASSLHTTACGHAMCDACLRRYVESRPSDERVHKCPVCRQPLSPADYGGATPQASIAVTPQPREEVWTRKAWAFCYVCCIIVMVSIALFTTVCALGSQLSSCSVHVSPETGDLLRGFMA